MNYYVLEFNEEFDCLIDDQIPSEFDSLSLNLGANFSNLPTITLVSGTERLPDCIPNHRRYLFFSQKLIHFFKEFGFSNYQAFDVKILSNMRHENMVSHKLINILNVVDCIDRNNSKLYIDEDEEDEDLNIIDIHSLKLDDNKLTGNLICRLRGFETLLLFREDIVKAIVEADCTGLTFVEADGYRV